MNYAPTPTVPPHSVEVEEHVLQVLVQNPKTMVYAEEVLNADCFYVGNHQIIFECMAQAYADGGRTGFVALIQALVAGGHSKDAQKLALKLKNGYASELDFVGNISLLGLLSTQRKLLSQSMQITRAIYAKEDMEMIVSHASEMADIVIGQNRQIQKMHLSDSVDELCALLDKPRVGGLSGVNTGLGLINGQTDGWHSSDVVVMAGRPGMGKTAAAIYHAYHAALSGIPTAYISLEMPKTGITSRMVSNLTSIDYGRIIKADVTPYERDHVKKSADSIRHLPLYYYDYSNSWDIADIALTMRSWKRKYGIGIIFMDYVQLVRDRSIRNASDETAIVASVSRKTKQLQSQLDIPIIELAQLSRTVETRSNKRPTMSDLKQSGQLEQDASTVIFLYRHDYYEEERFNAENKDPSARFIPDNEIEYIFAKNRNGKNGSIKLRCKMQYNRIYEVER